MGVIVKWQKLLNGRLSSLETSYLYNTIETKAEEEASVKEKHQNHGKFPFEPTSTTQSPASSRKQNDSTSVSQDNGSSDTRVWVTMGDSRIIQLMIINDN